MAFEYFRLTHATAIMGGKGATQAGWQPPADVYEDCRGWLIKFELAGVRPADIQLEVQGRRLTVRGVRHDWNLAADRHFHRLEISYDRFERSIELPCNLDSHHVATEYRDGMLLVRLTCDENP
jgi:HSP20 family protein